MMLRSCDLSAISRVWQLCAVDLQGLGKKQLFSARQPPSATLPIISANKAKHGIITYNLLLLVYYKLQHLFTCVYWQSVVFVKNTLNPAMQFKDVNGKGSLVLNWRVHDSRHEAIYLMPAGKLNYKQRIHIVYLTSIGSAVLMGDRKHRK